MKIEKPTKFELKRVQRSVDCDEDNLTDREIWIYREYF